MVSRAPYIASRDAVARAVAHEWGAVHLVGCAASDPRWSRVRVAPTRDLLRKLGAFPDKPTRQDSRIILKLVGAVPLH